ncbi:MAG: ABC transporter substrate-binding protein, partial [Chitinivibrionales bacterium]|nr:ABC transporter substrate-binding protein [Chitinivibrionales bacterium]
VEKLINNHKVDLLLSTHGGELIMASCAAAERAQKYYHATTCFPHQWLPANYKWSTVYFFDGAAATEVPCKILETVPKAERPKNFALLMEDSPDGIGFTGLAKASVEKYGYAVAMQDPLPIGKEDYSSLIMKMKEKKVDAILILTSPHDAMVMIRQVREMGVNTKFIFGWKGTWTSEFARILGKNSDYILSDGFWSEAFPYPGAKELGQLFFSEFNRNSISAGLFYAHTQVLLKAIASAGSLDSKKVRDAVVGKKFTGTVMGDVKYDAKGVALFEAIANQWVDGKRVLIYPFAGASKMKLIPVKVTY